MIEYTEETPRVFLLAVHIKSEKLEIVENSIDELASLARTLDFEIVGSEIQSRATPDPKSYIGSGKIREIHDVVKENKISLVLFDHELTPNQGKNLETALGCMVWDRTQVILEIFSQHARTPESRDQVELAQLEYMLPRLVGLWAHLDREKGGISASRGTGEKQIAIDRKLIRQRITRLGKSLKKIASERAVQSKKRKQGCFQVGVVGYTNAGKTTLINQLTGANLLAEDKLFATLESATRVLKCLSTPNILISDTVGFIRNLPHNLVASFRSTLSVVREADLLLHVVDGANPGIEQYIETTEEVLREIQADAIPRILVLNKMDLIEGEMDRLILKKTYPDSVAVSAFDQSSVDHLRQVIKEHFESAFVSGDTLIPYDRANLLQKFYQLGTVEDVEYAEDGIHIKHAATIPNSRILEKLLKVHG